MFFHPRSVRRRRGSILLMSMIFMAVIAIVMIPVMQGFTQMSRTAQSSRASDAAFYVAEAGIARAMSYIFKKGGGQVTGVYDAVFDVTQANAMNPFSADWVSPAEGINAAATGEPAVRVRIWHDTSNGNWKIQAVGRMSRPYTIYRTVTATIQTGSFARYAFFNTASVSAMDGLGRWLAAGETFNGPVHSNGDLFVTGTAADHLVFNSDVTIVGNEVLGSSASYVDYHGLKDTNADYVDLPTNMSRLTNAAASGGLNLPAMDTSVPSTWGYTDADGINNYKFVFNSDGTVTVTNLDAKTWAAAQSPAKPYTPMTVTITNTNGAMAVNNGNVFVSGTVKGSVTVAALSAKSSTTPVPAMNNTKSDGNVIVDGQLVYSTHPKDSGGNYIVADDRVFDPNVVTDTLGLIAERNFALDDGAPAQEIIDSHIMVTGQATTNPDVRTWSNAHDPNSAVSAAINQDGAFYIEDGVQQDLSKMWTGYGTNSGGINKSGDLYLTGGVVHFLRGQTKNGSGGYDRHYSFDSRLLKTPPPYYPLTPDLEIVGWSEAASRTLP